MLKQAELKMRQLLFDDSGIAMAYTIMVFLVFFMICVSTYAMSENIRKKMELQNYCDAYAYSRAVLQADILSRIAVLNRALSWTYAETNKRQMDETVYDWLQQTLDAYDKQCSETLDVAKFHSATCKTATELLEENGISSNGMRCTCDPLPHMCWVVGRRYHPPDEPKDEYFGYPGIIVLNPRDRDPRNNAPELEAHVSTIRTALAQFDRGAEHQNIETGKKNIDILNDELSFLTGMIFNQSAVIDFGDIMVADVGKEVGTSVFERETDEEILMNYSRRTVDDQFQRGYDLPHWWILQALGDDGIGRNYEGALSTNEGALSTNEGASSTNQGTYSLRSRFEWSVIKHVHVNGEPPCVNVFSGFDGCNEITGTRREEQICAKPWRLTEDFFGRDGSIVVAAAYKDSINPFSGLFGTTGIYSLFFPKLPVAISAARAGIRLKNTEEGKYSVFYPGKTTTNSYYKNGVWNLCEEDWDAVMLPISRAWCKAPAGTTTNFDDYDQDNHVKYSSDAILEKAYELLFGDGLARPANVDNFMWH